MTVARETAYAGLFNFRDVGGRPTPAGPMRTGRLFRSNALFDLREPDIAILREAGIEATLDIREPGESARDPVESGDLRITQGAYPFIGRELHEGERQLEEFMYSSLVRRAGRVARVVEQLAETADRPTVFFCVSGKDRTGLVAGVIQSALGVSDVDVAADFHVSEALTPQAHVDKVKWASQELGVPEEVALTNLAAPVEMMLEILRRIRAEHGSVDRYLIDHGVPDAALDRLRAELIDDR